MDSANNRLFGTVRFFNHERGFGFITPDGSGPDVFVHASASDVEINEGDRASYEVIDGHQGKKHRSRCRKVMAQGHDLS